MRTVDNYRGLQIHIFDRDEEVPPWVRTDVGQGRAVMAIGEFRTTSALAHILDRYIDEVLREQAEPAQSVVQAQPPRRPPGGRR